MFLSIGITILCFIYIVAFILAMMMYIDTDEDTIKAKHERGTFFLLVLLVLFAPFWAILGAWELFKYSLKGERRRVKKIWARQNIFYKEREIGQIRR